MPTLPPARPQTTPSPRGHSIDEQVRPATNFNAGVTRAIGVLAVAGILFFAWRAAGPSSAMAWHDNVDDAIESATQKGKPILAFFTADWCGPCQQFKKDVLADSAVERELNARFVLVKLDLTDNSGPAARTAQQLGVRSIPTLIVYDTAGQHIDTAGGGLSASQFFKWLEVCESNAR